MNHTVKLILTLALCALTFTSTAAFADPNRGFYSGAALSSWQYDQTFPSADGRLLTLEFNAGFWFHPLLSAEMRLGTGLGDEDIGDNWEAAIDGFGSVYWRPEVSNEVAKLYGLLGYSHVEMSADSIDRRGRQSTDASDTGPSFGAGVGFFYNQNVVLNLEWKQLIDADGFEVSGFTAGFDYRF